jgi:tetratricopeptide (TPR) repeat protein
VVLWVPEYALTAIAQGAPDFFSIRSSVYFFAATPDEIAHLAQNLSAGEWWEVDNLSHTEKQDRIIAIQRLLADYKSLSEKQQDSFTERRLIGQLGALFDAQGDYEAALSQYDHSLKMAEKLGDPEGIAISLHEIGNLYYQRGEYEAALSLYERSQKIFEELDHRMGVASSLHQMGRTQAELGEYDAALSLYEQSLKMFEEADNVAGVASSLHQIGMVQQACENYEAALNYYESSLRLKKSLGNIAGVASSLHQIGNLNYLRGEYTAALEQYEQSLKIAEELGDRVGMATTRAQLSKVFIQLGRYPDAFRNLLFALTTFVELQLPYMRLAANELKKLRIQWGAANFNSAWQQTTGEDVPEWLSQDEGAQT